MLSEGVFVTTKSEPAGIRTQDTRIKSPMYPVPAFTVIYRASPSCRRARVMSLSSRPVVYRPLPEFRDANGTQGRPAYLPRMTLPLGAV